MQRSAPSRHAAFMRIYAAAKNCVVRQPKTRSTLSPLQSIILPVRFSIITPSYRSSRWLRLCIASVADQNVELEHIVQDAGSDDGTLDWLPQDRRVKAFV